MKLYIKHLWETRTFLWVFIFIVMKEIKGIIYIYTNKTNGKVYIGQTINEDSRMIQHKYAYENTPFEKAIKEEGWYNFNYSVLYKVIGWDKKLVTDVLDSMEQYYIALYQSTLKVKGYNVSIGGKTYFYNKTNAKLKCVETGIVYNNILEAAKSIHVSPIMLFNLILKRSSIKNKHFVYTGEYNIPNNYPTELE